MKIDWDSLETAFTTPDRFDVMGEAFLDRTTGEVIWFGGEDGEPEDPDPALDPARFEPIPTLDTDDEVDWMNDFRRSVRNRALLHSLDQAFSGGKGFFRRFKDALARHNALDQWRELRNRRIAEKIIEWLRASKIEFEGVPRALAKAGISAVPPVKSDGSPDEDDEIELPVRATIENVLIGTDIIRLGDAIEAIESSVRDAEFEYEVTVRVRAARPLAKKAREALERHAIQRMGARPKFVEQGDDSNNAQR